MAVSMGSVLAGIVIYALRRRARGRRPSFDEAAHPDLARALSASPALQYQVANRTSPSHHVRNNSHQIRVTLLLESSTLL